MPGTRLPVRRTILIVGIMLAVASLHFVTGGGYAGPCREFVTGHLIDLLLPFGLYFLLCLDGIPLKSWISRGVLVFGVAAAAETTQLSTQLNPASVLESLDS